MDILITGGAGFIGSNLAHKLYREGHTVYIIDDLSEGNPSNLKGTDHTLIEGDIRQWGNLKIVKDMDLIYHLACKKMVYSIKNPLPDLCVNIGGTLKLLEMARKHNVPLVFTSTGSVYGNPDLTPTPEDYPKHPLSPYGVSKLAAEEYCKMYFRIYGLKTFIVRPHSVYGPNQKTIGVIPKFIEQTLSGKPMTIEGDGTQSRTFTNVDDFNEALTKVAAKGKAGEAYNISGNLTYTINDLAEIIAEILDKPMKTKFTRRKKGDLEHIQPSIEKIKKLGWHPKTNLRQGIRKLVELNS